MKSNYFNFFNIYTLIAINLMMVMITIDGKPIFISLGKDCEVALRLRQFNLRIAAYPFDWMNTNDFPGLCKALKNDFQDFLNPKYLIKNKISVSNTYYDLHFRHDFPYENTTTFFVVDNWLDYLPAVQEKVYRRINRLYNSINDKNSKIIFIRTNIKPEAAKKFVDIMYEKFPSANYFLVVVHNYESLIGDWGIPHVINFYVNEYSTKPGHIPQGWYHENSWDKVFSQLKNMIDEQVRNENVISDEEDDEIFKFYE